MNTAYYDMIFKRKSFHLFRGLGEARLTAEELREIEEACRGFEPLCPGIRTAFRIVPAEKVNFKRDAEYCVMIYSDTNRKRSTLPSARKGAELKLALKYTLI